MSALAYLFAMLPLAPPADVHHVLVIDDSGSMESDFDVHGFGLAVPQIFHRFVGADHPERLTVMTLAQGSPIGPVERLGPGDYLEYARENGTSYAKAIAEAVKVARASNAARVEIALVTDAEPEDALARAAIDDAMHADPRIHFNCFQLGTTDPGDLCVGHTSFAKNGFDMARLTATHLARTMGSIPRWGRIDKAGQSVPIPLGRFVSRVHLLMLGARAGEDFAAELVRDQDRDAVTVDHTRPVMTADMGQQAGRSGPRSPMELPVGPRPQLALGTATIAVDPSAAPELRLVKSDGPVAWGVMLEYDLEVALEAPATIDGAATTIPVRAHLLHKGVHVDDVAALKALGLEPRLAVIGGVGRASSAPTPESGLAMSLGADGWATLEAPAAVAETKWQLVARFTSDTADLACAPHEVARSAAPPAPAFSAWLPPTLDLPEWTLEHQHMTYTLTVLTAAGKPLTGAEISAQKLTAAIVLDGVEVPMVLNGDRFEVTRPLPAAPSTLSAELVLRHPTGEVRSLPDRMDVLPDANVRLPPAHDFGTVDAGCDRDAACAPLDLRGSRALDRTTLRVTRTDAFDDLTVTLRRGEESYPITRDEPVELAPSAEPISACWAPAGCTDLPDDLHAALTIAPADPRLATPERSASTRIAAIVTPSSWLTCNLWWCLLIVGGLLTLFIIWGYVRPHAFPSGAFIQVADQERRLARDPGRPLRSVPHGRRGFYRTATCAMDPSGFTVKRTRSHVVQLKADRGRIALVPRGAAIERRQRGSWVSIDRRAEPFLLSGATYRVNQSFVFRVLA